MRRIAIVTCRQRGCAIALGARADEVPRGWAELQAYIDREYEAASIAVSARRARSLPRCCQPVSGRAAAPLTALATLLAAGLLPAPVRRDYGFAWNRRRKRAFNVTVRVLRLARRALPDAIAWWPQARLWRRSATGRAPSEMM